MTWRIVCDACGDVMCVHVQSAWWVCMGDGMWDGRSVDQSATVTVTVTVTYTHTPVSVSMSSSTR